MIAHSVRTSERNSVVMGSNPTQANFYRYSKESFNGEYHTIYIYIYIYIYKAYKKNGRPKTFTLNSFFTLKLGKTGQNSTCSDQQGLSQVQALSKLYSLTYFSAAI